MSFTSLRAIVENITIALQLELSRDRKKYRAWLDGDQELKFGNAASQVHVDPRVAPIETHLVGRIGNDLFRQKHGAQRHGHVRELFSTLSKYAHAHPGYTDFDLWESSGPVFSARAFVEWANAFAATYAFAVLALRLGLPGIRQLDGDYRTLKELFDAPVGLLAPRAPLRRALRALPASIW